ncbi:putative short-chain dehydrogenase/reductase family 42E member 2 [Hyperolius riggenbachi]|uniref:putative short-chain dehydrogenase/reductase family 42E member 2 n=1 Tax=Hyperolius riggenbachi TaxID=752182 RepID=UPI0035A38D4C
MRETRTGYELEDLRNRIGKEEFCSECIRNSLPCRTVRSNGVVPHQSRGLPCMPSAHPGTYEISKVLVTGGAGYLGQNLGCALTKLGYSVVLFDMHQPDWDMQNPATFVQGDIRDHKSLYKACEGVDCVFHVASFGMSGYQQLQKKQIESINIEGTQVVIDVCVDRNIPRLIYTSTVNVVFGGNQIEEGDEETTTYYPSEKQQDHYSKTKTIADQMILAANGTPLKGGSKLLTCVLRPPGIYGPGEKRHLPRMVDTVEKSLLCFKFWDDQIKMNWIHLYNLVDAHILAAEALTANKAYIASGKAYFIHDGEPITIHNWFHPLFDKLGFPEPRITLPFSLVYSAAVILEYIHLILRPFIHVNPLLTRNEVLKIAVMHTVRIDKARKELGFNPKPFSFADAVDFHIKSRPRQSHKKMNISKIVQVLVCLFVCFCLVLLFSI